MRFNKYIWDLYKATSEGQEKISYWSPRKVFPDNEFAIKVPVKEDIARLEKSGLGKYINGQKVNYRQLRYDHLSAKYDFRKENIRELYSRWIVEGLSIKDFVIFPSANPEFWINMIRPLSKMLYDLHPDYFFPYTLECEFNKFHDIFSEFNIPIPELPRKSELHERAFYYLDLCDALFEFRKDNDFSPAELCAFLYGFAPGIMKELEDTEMPPPSKVWFIGGNKDNFDLLDDSGNESLIRWQGNIDTRKGDILVIYCLSPRSYIHSIWRSNIEGFADPFFYWYSVIEMRNPIKLDVHITQKDLENNPVWSVNPLVRKNLQGINGYPIKYPEYLELLSMLKSKGQNTDILPVIKPTNRLDASDLKDERDVEIRLIEPFLKMLAYKPEDWIRQMPVRMGRGERYYPDFCFGAVVKRGEEKASMILESKFEIKTQKSLQEAYFQAKSYALRLQAEKLVIAAKEGIWIFQKKDDVYNFNDFFHFTWIEIEDPDLICQLRNMIGAC